MYQINKNSHLVTVPADTKLADLKKVLIEEGLYFGYQPLGEPQHTLNHYLSRRVPNLYHFKYGSIADLTCSLLVKLPDNKNFQLKDAPRAAIGPDFNRMIIGGREKIGIIQTATLKIISIPEKVIHGIVLVNSREDAREIVRYLVGQFMRPLYCRFLNLDDSSQMLDQLKIKTKATEVFVFCLSGLKEIVGVSQEVVDEHCQILGYQAHWVMNKREHEVVRFYIHSPEAYKDILDQYRYFLWQAADNTQQGLWEKDFTDSLGLFSDLP